MAKLWLASTILFCVAVTVLKSAKLNNRESGACNKSLITRRISKLFHGLRRVASKGNFLSAFKMNRSKIDQFRQRKLERRIFSIK